MKVVVRKISELKPATYNPREMSAKEYKDLKQSMETFGIVEPLLINVRKGRENVVISGHQRLKIWKELGNKEIPCIEHSLTLKQEKELNLRMNRNHGRFDYDLLANNYDEEMLLYVGFVEAELAGLFLDDFETEFEKHDDSNAEMPIVPKFNENYSSVLVMCDNELDENWLRNVLGLRKAKDYKSSRVKDCYVITVKDLQEKWDEND